MLQRLTNSSPFQKRFEGGQLLREEGTVMLEIEIQPSQSKDVGQDELRIEPAGIDALF